jgi:hypothetical protein
MQPKGKEVVEMAEGPDLLRRGQMLERSQETQTAEK